MQTFLLVCFAGFTGYLFSLAHLPLPWTLGPLAATMFWSISLKRPVRWPRMMRNIGLTFLGYVMGSPFTAEIGHQVLLQLPLMLFATIFALVACLISGYLAGRFSGVGTINSLIGSMPGGLSQMSAICEEINGADPAIITLMQTVRVVTVVFFVPALTLHGFADHYHSVQKAAASFNSADWQNLLLFGAVLPCLILLHKRLGLPNPYLLAPVVGTAGLVISGIHPPQLPSAVISAAQICVGIRMGAEVGVGNLANWKKIALSSFISIILVIFVLLGFSYLFSLFTQLPFTSVFISTAPGGITEMGLTAMMIDADLPTVISYQMFRLMFILIVAIPTVRWYLRKKTVTPNEQPT